MGRAVGLSAWADIEGSIWGREVRLAPERVIPQQQRRSAGWPLMLCRVLTDQLPEMTRRVGGRIWVYAVIFLGWSRGYSVVKAMALVWPEPPVKHKTHTKSKDSVTASI